MRTTGYLVISNKGSVRFVKGRVGTAYNEILVRVGIEIPDQFFQKPVISANITVDKNLLPKDEDFSLIINTKELIEQSTGAKIDFTLKRIDEEEEKQ